MRPAIPPPMMAMRIRSLRAGADVEFEFVEIPAGVDERARAWMVDGGIDWWE